MTTIRTHATVGPDGKLIIPLSAADAGTEVDVTISPIAPPRQTMTQEEWQAHIDRTAGSIDDPTFERPPQGEYEERESLD